MPQPAPTKPPMPAGKKLLFGCVGCFGLAVLLAILAWVFIMAWVKKETVPAGGEALLGPDTVSIVVVAPDGADAGVTAFVRALGQQIDRDHPEAIDAKIREHMKSLKKEDASAILLSCLPITWAMASTNGPLKDEACPVVLLSLSHWSNPVALLGEKEAEGKATTSVPHSGTKIHTWAQGDETEGIAFLDNHIVRGPDAKSIGAALDGLTSGKGPTGFVKELRDRLTPKPHAWGLLVNQGDAAMRDFGFLEGLPMSSAEVLGIAWEINVKGAEESKGRFHVKARDKAVADTLDRALAQRSEEVRYALKQEHDIEATFSQRVEGQWVVIDFEVKDLARRIIKSMSEGR